MDLSDRLLELLGGARPGDRLGPGVLVRTSSELGLRYTFDVDGLPVVVEVALSDEDRKAAARSARLAFAYRSGDSGDLVPSEIGLALCREVAALAARSEERVLAAVAADAASARDADEGGTRIREVSVRRLLEPTGSGAARHYTLTPYVGCLVGCRFCYAQRRVAGVRRLEQLPETPWGSYVDVRAGAAEVLERELRALPARPIKFCPIVSDPYQAVEARYRVTRSCLEVIARAPAIWPVLVLTRARLIERDADVLAALSAGYAGMSIPTVDDEVRRHFEPRAASIPDRLAVLSSLRALGVRTFAVVQPILPGSIDALAGALAGSVLSVSIDVLRGTEGAAREFGDPRYHHAEDDAWQRARAEELRAGLTSRGVAVWDGDLPPELLSS